MTPLFVARSKAELPNATVTQSSAMMPLTWHMAILVAGTVGAAAVSAPNWLIEGLAALTGGTVLLAWTTYFRLLRSDREALRSRESIVPKIVTERVALAPDQETYKGVLEARGGTEGPPSLPSSSTTERKA